MRSKPVLRKTNQIRTHSVVGWGAGDPTFMDLNITNIKTNLVTVLVERQTRIKQALLTHTHTSKAGSPHTIKA